MSDIVAAAEAKLARITEREGDADGIRRRPEYLYQLIAEEIAQRDFISHTKRKAPTAPVRGSCRGIHNQDKYSIYGCICQ